MTLDYLPLLQTQRDLYEMPPGPARFRAYLRQMTDPQTGDLKLPLGGMNPMAKAHLPAYLGALLAMNADAIADEAVKSAAGELPDVSGDFRVCIVVSDDSGGGWTNRYAAEFACRFEAQAVYKCGWIVATLWASEAPTPASVRQTVREAIFRAAFVRQHGSAQTVGEMLAQEGHALHNAGAILPVLDADDIAYTRVALAPYRDHTDRPTVIAALFGDAAAHELGYRPLGLSARAGLALARHEAENP